MRVILGIVVGIALGLWWATPPDVAVKPSPIVSHCLEYDEDGPTINIHGVCDEEKR